MALDFTKKPVKTSGPKSIPSAMPAQPTAASSSPPEFQSIAERDAWYRAHPIPHSNASNAPAIQPQNPNDPFYQRSDVKPLMAATNRDVLGEGKFGLRGWMHDHPIGMMAAMAALTAGGAALMPAAGAAGAGAGASAAAGTTGGTVAGLGTGAAGGLQANAGLGIFANGGAAGIGSLGGGNAGALAASGGISGGAGGGAAATGSGMNWGSLGKNLAKSFSPQQQQMNQIASMTPPQQQRAPGLGENLALQQYAQLLNRTGAPAPGLRF